MRFSASRGTRLLRGVLLAGLLLAPGCTAALAVDVPEQIVQNGKVVGRRVPAQAGDICASCYNPVDEKGAVYEVQGQRVALHLHEAESDLGAQILRLAAQLRPRGAFLGTNGNVGLSPFWFFSGVYVLFGLLFGALAAHRALLTGNPPLRWFLIGFFFTLPGYVYVLTQPRREVFAPAGVPSGLKKIARTAAPAPCPKCGAENHPSANRCTSCGGALEPELVSEVHRAGLA